MRMVHLRRVMTAADDARLTVVLPVPVVRAVWGSSVAAERDIRERIVLALFAEGKLSSGKAAGLLGASRWNFMDLLVRQKVPWPITPEDVEQDLARLDAVMSGEGRA